MVDYAPIAVFVYNRARHTREMLLNLRKCEGFAKSPLYVFCDGPKNQETSKSVEEVRSVVRELVGDTAKIIESENNQGLANSIIKGVTRLCDEYGQVIVLEDDLIVSSNFLIYMNKALDKYNNEASVMQISGHMFDVPAFKDSQEAMFLPFTTSWGWATWKRAWDCFDENAEGWGALKSDAELRKSFNLDGSFDYFSMLQRQMHGKSDSWAIRWYWSVFKNNGCVLFPPRTLVDNTGFDGSGTNGWRTAQEKMQQKQLREVEPSLPDLVLIRAKDLKFVQECLNEMHLGMLDYFRLLKGKALSMFKC